MILYLYSGRICFSSEVMVLVFYAKGSSGGAEFHWPAGI